MKSVKFDWCNCTYAEAQEQYLNLPAYRAPGKEGLVTSCWGLTFWERIRILFEGKFYLTMLTFGHPLQPISVSIRKPKRVEEE